MSGGHFEYRQQYCGDMADKIDRIVAENDSTEKDDFGYEKGRHYTRETIERFEEAAHALRQAGEMAQRVDWLLSGDDGEESFHRRWFNEVRGNFGS